MNSLGGRPDEGRNTPSRSVGAHKQPTKVGYPSHSSPYADSPLQWLLRHADLPAICIFSAILCALAIGVDRHKVAKYAAGRAAE